jgi:membrane associated rhomboid family serine protease
MLAGLHDMSSSSIAFLSAHRWPGGGIVSFGDAARAGATSRRPAYDPRVGSPARRPRPARRADVRCATPARDTGTFALVAANVACFLADKGIGSAAAGASALKGLYLHHLCWRWWQLVTSLFLHGSFGHLSGNLFFLLVFGRFVEEKAGAAGVVLTYLVTGVFANLASLLLLSGPVVSLGASGAVFGLFVVAALARERTVKGFVEMLILGNFVVTRVLEEGASSLTQSGASRSLVQTNHIAHLGGALGGVLLVVALRAVAGGKERVA